MSDSDPSVARECNAPFVVSADIPLTEDELVKAYTQWVLLLCGGNKSHAARMLGIDRRSLYRRLGLCLDKREGSHAAGR